VLGIVSKPLNAGRIVRVYEMMGRERVARLIRERVRAHGGSILTRGKLSQAEAPEDVASSGQSLSAMWERTRPVVIANWDLPARLRGELGMSGGDEVSACQRDAYHSLSLEGYEITPEEIRACQPNTLIDDFSMHAGDNDGSESQSPSSGQLGSLIAHGYFRAYASARQYFVRAVAGDEVASISERGLLEWRKALLLPSVLAGVLSSGSAVRWRTGELKGPEPVSGGLPAGALPSLMDQFFALLSGEENPAVRAVLAHFFLLYMQPCEAANGCLARFLMNVMLGSGGWPWIVIPAEMGTQYRSTVHAAVAGDIAPLTKLIASLVQTAG
jgi:hypothetical protein